MPQEIGNQDATQLIIDEKRRALIRVREAAHGVRPGTYADYKWLRKNPPLRKLDATSSFALPVKLL